MTCEEHMPTIHSYPAALRLLAPKQHVTLVLLVS